MEVPRQTLTFTLFRDVLCRGVARSRSTESVKTSIVQATLSTKPTFN